MITKQRENNLNTTKTRTSIANKNTTTTRERRLQSPQKTTTRQSPTQQKQIQATRKSSQRQQQSKPSAQKIQQRSSNQIQDSIFSKSHFKEIANNSLKFNRKANSRESISFLSTFIK